jgi:S-DNA-T family DNA segregation ATPase FtsK/SpoIIIE
VHPLEGIALPSRPGERHPVIPGHLRTWTGVRNTVARHGGLVAHRGAYHAVRSPAYVLLVIVWATYGLLVTIGHMIRWWWLAEQTHLRSQAVISGDAKEWRNLHQDARDTRRSRGIALITAAAAVLLGTVLMLHYAPWWGWALLVIVVLPLLARAGRPTDKPIIRPATTTPRFRVLNADVVLRAYYAAGLGHPDKPGQQITFGTPMSRDGDGSRVAVDLPFGKGLDDAVKGRPAIASGLGHQGALFHDHSDGWRSRVLRW